MPLTRPGLRRLLLGTGKGAYQEQKGEQVFWHWATFNESPRNNDYFLTIKNILIPPAQLNGLPHCLIFGRLKLANEDFL